MSGTMEYVEALDVVRSTDPRWREGREAGAFGRPALEAFAHALAFLADGSPDWAETVSTAGLGDRPDLEVRVLTSRTLLVMSAPSVPPEGPPDPTVLILPLRTVRGMEVDGLRFADDGLPSDCTVALRFPDASVRLGVAAESDRAGLAGILPFLRDHLRS